MKASELMIMDWVLLDGTPIQVAGLHNRKVGVHKRRRSIYCRWHSDGEFRPIPLTGDILVSNGFEYAYNEVSKMQNKQLLVANIGSHYIEIRLDKRNVAIWYDYDEDGDSVYSDVLIDLPHHVHNFQHLLRLVGVQKEIEL